jgi:Tol biopolymer transport system component
VGAFAIDTSTITRLVLDEAQKYPEWSADGKTIVFQHRANYMYEGLDLAVVGVTLGDAPSFGTPSVIHTPEGGTVAARPAVSPDGRWIAFTHRIYGGKSEVERIRCDGEGLTVLTTRINLPWAPHWSPAWENDLD